LADDKNEFQEQKEKSEGKEKPVGVNPEVAPAAVKELQEKVAALEEQLGTKTGEVAGLEDRLARLGQDFEGAKAAYAYAVEDYKRLASSANPVVPVEAIHGTTVEEVKGSLDRALKLVASVQDSLAKQVRANSVPAGAPVRTGQDTSVMSSKEKINYGLEQARKKKE